MRQHTAREVRNLTVTNTETNVIAFMITHIIEERERFPARRMVVMADSGVSF